MTDDVAQALVFADDGAVPNNRLPLLLWRKVIPPDAGDPAAAFEERFARNGWPPSWRNGVYPYVHFHTNTHETLGVAAGRVRVRLGGASDDLLVVGAYPPGIREDLHRDATDDADARARIAAVARPARDPVNGNALWADHR